MRSSQELLYNVFCQFFTLLVSITVIRTTTNIYLSVPPPFSSMHVERGKRDFDCDKQVEKAVTAPNCMLKDLWGEEGSGGIRKKLKSEYADGDQKV